MGADAGTLGWLVLLAALFYPLSAAILVTAAIAATLAAIVAIPILLDCVLLPLRMLRHRLIGRHDN
jgi:hypothetical protein